MGDYENVILGGGLAGMAAYSALSNSNSRLIIEKTDRLLGHCKSHELGEYSFDEGVHVCHSTNKAWLRKLNLKDAHFIKSSDVRNIYKGKWIGYPIQNNLCDLDTKDRDLAYKQIKACSEFSVTHHNNYEDWLINTYGEFLYKNFYRKFTLKYWRSEPSELGLDWLAGRLLPVEMNLIDKGLEGSNSSQAVFNSYFYPRKGGFQSLFKDMIKDIPKQDTLFDSEIISIDPMNSNVILKNEKKYNFKRLIYTLPLPQISKFIHNFPEDLALLLNKLRYTQLFSLAVKIPEINSHDFPDWFYVYDENIDISRVFNVSKASNNNKHLVLQCETFRRDDEICNRSNIQESMMHGLKKLFPESEIENLKFYVTEFAYIVPLECNKEIINKVNDYLRRFNIISAGLYGLWKYRWSDQTYTDTHDLISNLSG